MRKDRLIEFILDNGTVFEGKSFGAEKAAVGEVVFSTAMVGYSESLTDSSYVGQILTVNFPLVGNYGVPGNIINSMKKNINI